LEQRARAEARKGDWLKRLADVPEPVPQVVAGPIAAGEKVIASTESEVFAFLRESYGDAIAVEMEGLGFLEAARANQRVAAMVIRGISDLIVGKGEADRGETREMAACYASAFAFQMLAKLGKELASGGRVLSNGATMSQNTHGSRKKAKEYKIVECRPRGKVHGTTDGK
jgi:nucleoside phosphorylase